MEKPIFDLLVEISAKDFIDFTDNSGVSNRDQRIAEDERNRKLEYLLNQGFISNTRNIYIITEYGFVVSQYKNWSEYLLHQKELLNKKIAKESNDLKISEFQVRTTYLPYFLSAISIILSVLAIYKQFANNKDNDDNYTKKDRKKEILIKNTQKDTILTIKAIALDSLKKIDKP